MLTKALDQTISNCLEKKLTTAIMTIVLKDGKTLYQKAAGFCNPEKQIPLQDHSLFRMSSVSKAFTSICTAALIEKEILHLDDPVTQWLPNFKPKTSDGQIPVITIKELLSHTAGLDYRWSQPEDGPYAKAGVSDGSEITGISLDENLSRIAKAPLQFKPGTSWLYSLSPDVLGAVIEKATQKPFQEALKAFVLDPLGLNDTMFFVPEKDRKRLTVPYFMKNGQLTKMGKTEVVLHEDGRRFTLSPERAISANEFASGGMGLVSSGVDLIKVVEGIRLNRFPMISESLMKTMSTNLLPNGQPDDPSAGFALGWGVLLNPKLAESPQAKGTLYWGGIYGHRWFADVQNQLSVIILTTTAVSVLKEPVSLSIRDTIYQYI